MEIPEDHPFHLETLDDLRAEIARLGLEIPFEENLDEFIRACREGDDSRAYEIIRTTEALPEMTAHLSPGRLHGEGPCIETAFAGDPVPILDLQLLVSRRARERGRTGVHLPKTSTGKQISIVGGGPAGLAAAIRSLEFGHGVEIYEKADQLGGTPQRVISSSRAPDFSPEIGAILEPARLTGRLRPHFLRTFGEDLDLDELRSGSDAVLLAMGVWQERSIGEAEGVTSGLEFLESVKRSRIGSVPNRVALLTGGDSAMDAAVEVQRLGAREIFIVFGGTRSEMHWHLSENWFQTPGVETMYQCQPLGYETDETGSLTGLQFRNCDSGREEILPVDLVIEAMGLEVADSVRAALSDFPQDEAGRVRVTEGSRTTLDRVYAAGGLINGGASVAQCLAEGRSAAETIHADLYL